MHKTYKATVYVEVKCGGKDLDLSALKDFLSEASHVDLETEEMGWCLKDVEITSVSLDWETLEEYKE